MRGSRATPWLLVATLTAAGAAAAAGYALTAPKHYRATAQLLVSPVASNDAAFAGLDVLRDVSGKPRAAETAAQLVRSPQVADAVRTQLGVRRSVSSLLGEVQARVAGRSNVVDVTVDDTSAAAAAQLANAFVDTLVAQRTTTFQSQLAGVIRRDAQLLAAKPAGPQAVDLSRRLVELRGFQGQADPSVRRASTALPPTSASSPVLWRLVLIGAAIGLALGALGFLALALLRRGGGVGAGEYARPVSDRAVNALVDRLERRLSARESALAVRERELQARIDELRSLEARDDVAQERALRAKEAELEERERAVINARDNSSQAEALRAKAAELADRERLLAEREEALRAAVAAAEDTGTDDAQLAEREPALAERIDAVTKRELAAARAHADAENAESVAAELAERERSLAERERSLAERIAAVQERELAVSRTAAKELELLERERALQEREQALDLGLARDTSSQARPREPEVTGAFSLAAIERLVEERGREFPDRIDEWESTVFFLRDYAENDGTLPGSFDWLVQDTFAPLLN